MSYRRVQKESDDLLYTGSVTRYGPQEVNHLRLNDVLRTSSTLCPQRCNIFLVSSIFKHNPGETNNKFIHYFNHSFIKIASQSFLSNDVISASTKRKRRFIVYGFGHSLWSAISCQRKVNLSR